MDAEWRIAQGAPLLFRDHISDATTPHMSDRSKALRLPSMTPEIDHRGRAAVGHQIASSRPRDHHPKDTSQMPTFIKAKLDHLGDRWVAWGNAAIKAIGLLGLAR